ncbi:MAG: hopanoid biosynthesis-associated transporter HpnN [Rhodospirillales bacterium]|nr:hopanoid biosynthesis-associated transporter HpnN [Rhodospirillales bacterium]
MSVKLSAVARLVTVSIRHAWLVIAAGLLLAIATGIYAAGHFKMTTDTSQLISASLPWRQNAIAFDETFPQQAYGIVAVVDGRTPELAERAAAVLAERLALRKTEILGVDRPEGGPFWDREGLLFLSQKEVARTTEQLIAAQPFLGPLASDPSLRGVMTSLLVPLGGVESGAAKLADVDKLMKALGGAMQTAADGRPAFFSWQTMLADGGGPSTRRFVIIRPVRDFSSLEPGLMASEAIRQTAREAGLDAEHGVTVRLTGSVPLSDEEFASLADRALLMVSVMLSAVLVMLWLAVRSARVTLAILGTTLIGLVITGGLGLATVGRFNLISVAFIPLFVGLGVDFGIQFAVKYRADSRLLPSRDAALIAAGHEVGGSLALAAAAIAAGFFAFLPTDYVGVSELGLIAGQGMVVAFLLNVTLLPALLHVLKPPVLSARGGFAALAPLDDLMQRRRSLVLAVNGLVALICIGLLPFVQFDSNPLDLKNPKSESMATLSDLMSDPERSPNTIDVPAPSLAAADALAARLDKLPEVAHAVTLSSFVPSDQAPKLAAIDDANLFLGPTIDPGDVKPAPDDAANIASLRQTADALRVAAGTDKGAAGQDALQLADALKRLAAGDPARRAAAQTAVVEPLRTLLGQLRALLQAKPLTLQTLPPEMVRQWTTPDGRARVQVFPKGGALSDAGIRRFAEAVRAVAPNASGGPISIVEAGRTIVDAFRAAGLLSLIVITLLLFAALRRVVDVVYTVLPVMLTGLLTLGTCAIIGQPINFANIIALPLLFGIGVAFHIYLVIAWRSGQAHFLTSSLMRAVLFSALTTGIAFGALWLSSHPGTASMGKLLMLSLAYTLATALFFGPALMGAPPSRKATPS